MSAGISPATVSPTPPPTESFDRNPPPNPFASKDLLKAYAALTRMMAPQDSTTIIMRSNLGSGSLFHLEGCRAMNRAVTEGSSVRLRAVSHITPAPCCRSDLAAVDAALSTASMASSASPKVRARWLLQLWSHLQRSQRFEPDVLHGASWVLPSAIPPGKLDAETRSAVAAARPPAASRTPLPLDAGPVDVVAVTARSAVGLLSDPVLGAMLGDMRVELSPTATDSAMVVLAQQYRLAEPESTPLRMIAIVPSGASKAIRPRLRHAVGESLVIEAAVQLSPQRAKLTVELAASGSFDDSATIADVAASLC